MVDTNETPPRPPLTGVIKEKLSINCINNEAVSELFRGIRCQLDTLLEGMMSESNLKAMQLGLSHSLSRYKLKFSADKVDTMIVPTSGCCCRYRLASSHSVYLFT
jgi:nucleolar protein 58